MILLGTQGEFTVRNTGGFCSRLFMNMELIHLNLLCIFKKVCKEDNSYQRRVQE